MKGYQAKITSIAALVLILLWVSGVEAGDRRGRRSSANSSCSTCTAGACASGTCAANCENGKCAAPVAAKASVAPVPDGKPVSAPVSTCQQSVATTTQVKTRMNRHERRSGRTCSSCGG